MEELQAKHRKEQRDLQSRITQKKKQATKKTRKGVNDECERLQRELQEKQRAEIARLNGEVVEEEVVQSLDDLDFDDGPVENGVKKNEQANASPPPPPSEASQPRKKVNRQKARLARRAAEREAEMEKASEEAAKQKDNRGDERKVMDETFSRLGLKEIEIRPDGHCLYSAVANQLADFGMSLTPGMTAGDKPSISAGNTKFDGYRDVRAATADFLLSHADDYAPFLEEPMETYAQKVKATTEWGGQLELQAIARAYGIHINVIQGDGRIEKFEPNAEENIDEDKRKTIWLAYYRHTYGLGEHYNALSKQS